MTLKTQLERLLGLTTRGRGRLPSAGIRGAIPAGRGVGLRNTGGGGGGVSSMTEVAGARTHYEDEFYVTDSSGLFVVVLQPIRSTKFAATDGTIITVGYQPPENNVPA